jgi:hypothetical protein
MGKRATAKIHQFPLPLRLECSACGKGITAGCGCGAIYVPAGQRAKDAVKRNPNKSDRAIADELGVGHQTVARARKKSTGPDGPVQKRTGKDGKARKQPTRPPAPVSDPVKEVNGFHRELVGFLHDFEQKFGKWHDAGPVLDENGKAALMQALYLCADGFARLAQKLDGR